MIFGYFSISFSALGLPLMQSSLTFNAELLDQVTIDFKRNFVVLVIANEFVHHMPQLHFQNWRIRIPLLVVAFHLQ